MPAPPIQSVAPAAIALVLAFAIAPALAAPIGPGIAGAATGDAGTTSVSTAAAELAEFEAAQELLGRDDAAAATRFEALANRSPDGEYADDALVQAAQLAEERLGHPDHARDLYARVLANYPTSRLALRARARHDFLDANLGAGNAALSEYQQILIGFASRLPAESARRMEALLVAHPDFSLAGQGWLWIASLAARDRRFDEAERRYRDIERRFAGKDTEVLARKGRADTELARGRPLDSLRLYRSVVDSAPTNLDPTPGRISAPVVEAARLGVTRAKLALYRLVGCDVAFAYLGLFVLASLLAARPLRARGLPLEVVFYLPIAALFVAATIRQNRPIVQAVAAIAVGGAVLLYASLVAASARRGRGAVSLIIQIVWALGLVLALAALAYAAMYQSDILDFVEETIKHGPDR